MLYLEYIVLAALGVFLSVRLSYYVDCLDKKTNLSGAFIGGVMLAAVTSLPELFTSLTAVLALDSRIWYREMCWVAISSISVSLED